ncbi:hypothetical protein MTo_01286 [Microcystis aeruginosa NIES-1211]|uniref:Uncharacterized protein n=1 Tax=Microcystis aeruginosa NIES-2519 TaxID=2303981 RepID=A0A5A5R4F3_MICAE|nr:hypothetical protein MTo_01286 [Microcystis aeruginosa NIES-1211]GCA71093.1 hypothetical protein MiYa_02632 [Microcystis aeruginosa NIES-2519]GCA82827.1 hypothetical protein MiHa_00784 [Microcystis aeruginosa NIES-2522]GCA87263.1 hypothetical protein MiTa_00589 [Microcystis aeruginosa NIES-4264]CCI30727.1 hypothetical protein MICAI_1340038 [Microcystis sp. T1-4]
MVYLPTLGNLILIFALFQPSSSWVFGVLVEISLITDNLPTDKWVGRIKYKMNVGWVEA